MRLPLNDATLRDGKNEHHVILDCEKGKKYHHTNEWLHFGTHSSGVKSLTDIANFI